MMMKPISWVAVAARAHRCLSLSEFHQAPIAEYLVSFFSCSVIFCSFGAEPRAFRSYGGSRMRSVFSPRGVQFVRSWTSSSVSPPSMM